MVNYEIIDNYASWKGINEAYPEDIQVEHREHGAVLFCTGAEATVPDDKAYVGDK